MSSGRPSGAYDGRWAVSLVCEDFADKAKVAKGYTSKFVGDVREGRLTGQQGQVGRPSSLTMVGSIQADGTAQLKVSGLTGDPEFTVGQVQPSTPFGFTMRGSFTQFKGKAQRVELRPCEATFLKR
jgi:hypothetical protein